jgi:hypothetical protein
MPAFDVDDAETTDAEGGSVGDERPAIIRPPVCHHVCHPFERSLSRHGTRFASNLQHTADAAHR